MGKRELIALLNLSSWCLVMVEWLFLAVPWGCLRFVIVVFPDHEFGVHSDVLSWVLFLHMFYCCLLAAVEFSTIPAFIFYGFCMFGSVMS